MIKKSELNTEYYKPGYVDNLCSKLYGLRSNRESRGLEK